MNDPGKTGASPSEPREVHTKKTVECPDGKDIPVRSKSTLGSLMSSAFTAKELRALDEEKKTTNNPDTSPRGVLELCKDNIESDTCSPDDDKTINNSPDDESQPTFCIASKPLSHWKKFIKQWKARSLKRLHTFPVNVHKISSRRRSKRSNSTKDDINSNNNSHDDQPNICSLRASWKIFSFSELKYATNSFSQGNLIGKGGFAEVYKGCLQDGQLVAVKKLTKGTNEEMISNFLSELGVIAHLDHPNTAKLIGYGVEEGLHLVLQLSSLGSLGSILSGSRENLDWNTRYKIALGITDGLLYLHDGCQRRIIHRDIKADNILLTDNYEPQICDFGLAMWLPRQCSHNYVTKFEGTFGYFAPEYFMHGIVDEKIDVYSYGVLLLELISGRRALDNSQQSLLVWAKPFLRSNDLKELADPCLGGNYDTEELDRVVLTASLCVEQSPVLRPRMNQAVVLIRGDDYAKGNQIRSIQRTYSEEILDAKAYNSTKYLNELRRHRQVAFSNIS